VLIILIKSLRPDHALALTYNQAVILQEAKHLSPKKNTLRNYIWLVLALSMLPLFLRQAFIRLKASSIANGPTNGTLGFYQNFYRFSLRQHPVHSVHIQN
jgi:hypothetical protein